MKLIDKGTIRLVGGCEVRGQLDVTMKPEGDTVTVDVENHQYMYDDNSRPLGPFSFILTQDEASGFLDRIKTGVESLSCFTDPDSTRDKFIWVILPVEGSIFEARLFEYTSDEQLDPVMSMIVDFLRKNRPEPPSSTKEFLGEGDDRHKTVIELSDAHGLWGGNNIMVRLDGNAMVQILFMGGTSPGKMNEQRFCGRISSEAVEDIIERLVSRDFVAIELEDRTGVPDELRIRLSVTNHEGVTHKISAWANSNLGPDTYQDSPRKRYDDIFQTVKNAAMAMCENTSPEYTGKYQETGWSELVARFEEKCE